MFCVAGEGASTLMEIVLYHIVLLQELFASSDILLSPFLSHPTANTFLLRYYVLLLSYFCCPTLIIATP
jgi:hypothetical protein